MRTQRRIDTTVNARDACYSCVWNANLFEKERKIRIRNPDVSYILGHNSQLTVVRKMKTLLTICITLLFSKGYAFTPNIQVRHRPNIRGKDTALSIASLPSSSVHTRSYRNDVRLFSSTIDVEAEASTADVSMDPMHIFLGDSIPYSEITIGVMKETFPGECRVSQSPDSVKKLVDAGFDVVVQAGGKSTRFIKYIYF